MAQQGWDVKIKKWNPRILLNSLKDSFLAWIGVEGEQLTLNEVAFSNVKTVKYTIGGIGVTADFNVVTAANQNEQVIDLGSIIPANARLLDVRTFTDAVFTGAVSLVAELGSSSSGHEYVNSATVYATSAINAMAADHLFTVVPNVAATKCYVSLTPGANWSLVTAGLLSVYITYIEAV